MILKTAILAAMSAAVCQAYGSGAPDCTLPSSSMMSDSQAGTGGYSISVKLGSVAATIINPGVTYDVTISGSTSYKGFLIMASKSSSTTSTYTNFVDLYDGFAKVQSDHQLLNCVSKATAAITHTTTRSSAPRSSDTFKWTAPMTVTTNIAFEAIVVVSKNQWYGGMSPIYTTVPLNSTFLVSTPPAPTPTNTADLLDVKTSMFGSIGALAAFLFQ